MPPNAPLNGSSGPASNANGDTPNTSGTAAINPSNGTSNANPSRASTAPSINYAEVMRALDQQSVHQEQPRAAPPRPSPPGPDSTQRPTNTQPHVPRFTNPSHYRGISPLQYVSPSHSALVSLITARTDELARAQAAFAQLAEERADNTDATLYRLEGLIIEAFKVIETRLEELLVEVTHAWEGEIQQLRRWCRRGCPPGWSSDDDDSDGGDDDESPSGEDPFDDGHVCDEDGVDALDGVYRIARRGAVNGGAGYRLDEEEESSDGGVATQHDTPTNGN